MPGPIFHVGGSAICPHGGQVTVISSNARVLVGGMPAATLGDVYVVDLHTHRITRITRGLGAVSGPSWR